MTKEEIVLVIEIIESLIALAEKINPNFEKNLAVNALSKAIAALELLGL